MDFTTWIDADTESGHSYYEDLSVRPAAGRTDWLSADVKGAVSDFTRMHDEFYRDMAARRLAHLGIPQDVARQGLDAVRAYIIERDHDDALTESARREMERGMETGRADRETDDGARTACEAAERITESEHVMRTYTTDAGVRDMVVEALKASQVVDDYDIDAITGDLMEAADYDGRAFTNVPEGDEFWEIVARHDTTEVSSSTALIGTGHVVAGAVSDIFGIEPVEATISFLAASAPGPVDVEQAVADFRAMLEASLPHGWEIRGGSVVRVLDDADRLDPHKVAAKAWPAIDTFTITEYTN